MNSKPFFVGFWFVGSGGEDDEVFVLVEKVAFYEEIRPDPFVWRFRWVPF